MNNILSKLGYSLGWDFSYKDNLYWDEFIDLDSGKMVMQLEQGVSEETFRKEWDSAETQGLPPFFVWVTKEEKDKKKLFDKIESHFKEK